MPRSVKAVPIRRAELIRIGPSVSLSAIFVSHRMRRLLVLVEGMAVQYESLSIVQPTMCTQHRLATYYDFVAVQVHFYRKSLTDCLTPLHQFNRESARKQSKSLPAQSWRNTTPALPSISTPTNVSSMKSPSPPPNACVTKSPALLHIS